MGASFGLQSKDVLSLGSWPITVGNSSLHYTHEAVKRQFAHPLGLQDFVFLTRASQNGGRVIALLPSVPNFGAIAGLPKAEIPNYQKFKILGHRNRDVVEWCRADVPSGKLA